MITVSTSKAYHHGDLRAALLETGLKALETCDIADLSLRQLARDTEVSPTAVYRHFPDKDALLAALAQLGIDKLAQWQQDAIARAGTGNTFAASGRAYVRWALANPALFRLAFVQNCKVRETIFGKNEAANLLRELAQNVAPDAQSTERLMIQAWSIVHGLAMLMLDGQLPRDETLIDRIIDPRTLFGGQVAGSSNELSP
jgi:AcrR family transcriptional regulator